MDRFDRWSSRVSLWLFRLGIFGALPALLLLVTIDVLFRYLFSTPLQWSRDANGLLLLVSLFSAIPYAWDHGHHIRMEIVYDRLNNRSRRIANVLSALAGLIFFLLLAAQAVIFTGYMLLTSETGEDLDIPLWPFMLFIAASGLVLAARLIASPGHSSQGSPLTRAR